MTVWPAAHRLPVNEHLDSLEAAARAALVGHGGRTLVFDHEGQRYVVKRLADKPRRLLQTLFMRWLVKRVTGSPLPMRTLTLSEAANSMAYEANRLKSLAAAGARVPHVVLATPELFVLTYCGTEVTALIRTWSQEVWRANLSRMASELGEFHAAGHWHGGAQIKNLTQHDGLTWRIDFEENFGEFLPLTATQTADLILFLNSTSLTGPIDESEARALLPLLLERYFAANPNPEIRAIIHRSLPLLRMLARIAGVFERVSRKRIRRVRILVDVMSEVS